MLENLTPVTLVACRIYDCNIQATHQLQFCCLNIEAVTRHKYLILTAASCQGWGRISISVPLDSAEDVSPDINNIYNPSQISHKINLPYAFWSTEVEVLIPSSTAI